VWKFEVKCIIREGDYSDVVILQSIRSSLKGPARNLLLTLSENAIPWQILDELEGVYSSDALLQIFFFSAVVNFPNDTFHFKLPHFECGFTLLVP
jgi:hypothetical protein